MVGPTDDGRVRHSQHPRGGVPVEPRSGDGCASGTNARRVEHRRPLPARRFVSRVARVRRACATAVGVRGERGRRWLAQWRREMTARRKQQRLLRVLAPLVVAVVALAAWQAAVEIWKVPPYIVPSPMRVAQTLATDRMLLL